MDRKLLYLSRGDVESLALPVTEIIEAVASNLCHRPRSGSDLSEPRALGERSRAIPGFLIKVKLVEREHLLVAHETFAVDEDGVRRAAMRAVDQVRYRIVNRLPFRSHDIEDGDVRFFPGLERTKVIVP